MPAIGHPKDFWSGVVFLAFAAGFCVLALEHPLGTAFRMGPAFFPLVLAAALGVLGAVTLVNGLKTEGQGPADVRPWAVILVSGGILLFAFAIRGLGLVVAVPLVVLMSAAASRAVRPLAWVLLAAGLTLFAWLVFVRLLGLPMPVLGPWILQFMAPAAAPGPGAP